MNRDERINISVLTTVEIGDLDEVEKLLVAGANVNYVGQGNDPALTLAAQHGHTK
ncbi:hypothetical protein [Spiroplasma endosymbiont of Nebria brevicollis]|uniref:hypothetical protein n=1 Tax=Spiroplasma endosymbiont of Nebria brevicollis TaxID=3066284 RepID=UPI00313B2751